MSEDIEKAFKGQAPGYSKHVGYTRYVNGKAIRVEGGAQPHQKVTLAAPGSVKHKGGEFLDRLHSYVHKKAPTTEHELQEAVHRFVHGKFEGDAKALQKFHSEGLKELSKHGLVTHHDPKAAVEPRKEAPHPADQELAERKKEKPKKPHGPSARELGSTKRMIEEQRKNAAANARIDKIPAKTPEADLSEKTLKELAALKSAAEKAKDTTAVKKIDAAMERRNDVLTMGNTKREEKALPKIPSFEDASHKRLSKLAEHPKAKKKAIAALAERIASKPEDATHADLHAELSALEQRHGIDAEERPERIGYHEAAVQRAMKKFPSGKAILDATGQDSPPHVKANAYEAARRLNEGQKAIPAPAQPVAKPSRDMSKVAENHLRNAEHFTPGSVGHHAAMMNYHSALQEHHENQGNKKESAHHKAEADKHKRASLEAGKTSPSQTKIGKFDEGSVRYLVDNMSESELRSRLPQASDSIKNNVNEALRRIAEKKEEKTS